MREADCADGVYGTLRVDCGRAACERNIYRLYTSRPLIASPEVLEPGAVCPGAAPCPGLPFAA